MLPIQVTFATPPCTYVFKTKDDYSNQVGIIYDKNRNLIVRFPVLKCMKKLEQGYYAVVDGCSPFFDGVAVTSVTWDEVDACYKNCTAPYRKFDSCRGIDPNVLLQNIVDYEPFTELYSCTDLGTYNVEELNSIIRNGELNTKCKKLK